MARNFTSVTTLLLSMDDLKRLLEMKDVLAVVENAFRLAGLKKVQMPPKMYLFFEKYNGDLRCMPSYIEDLDLSAVKIVNVHMNNPKKHDLRTIMATLVLIDPATGAPLAIMDGTHITDMRTGAASGIASKYLARKDSRSLGLIGAGFQARMQLLALLQTFEKLDDVRVYDILPTASENLVAESTERYRERIRSLTAVDNPKDAVEGMDIVVTCTTSRKPIVKNSWISPGQHINCIGADAPGKQEIEVEVLRRAKVVVDNWAQASHSGEINVPFSQGIFSEDDVYATIGDIVVGNKPGRVSDDEITLFCSTGLAIQDVLTAKLAFDAARKNGLGKEFELIQSI